MNNRGYDPDRRFVDEEQPPLPQDDGAGNRARLTMLTQLQVSISSSSKLSLD